MTGGTVDLIIEGCGSAGDGVGRLADGRAVFVAGGLPGDHVRARLTEVRKGVQYAEAVEILEASSDRVAGLCDVKACGGCPLRDASPALQARIKRQRLVDNLRRIGKLDVDELLGAVAQHGDGTHYRHRVRLHAAWDGGRLVLGYFGRRSHRVVPFESCPVLWPELGQAARALAESIVGLSKETHLESAEIAYSRRDRRAAAKLSGHGPMGSYRRSLDWIERSGLSAVEVESAGAHFSRGNLELRYDHANASAFDIRFEPGVFTQAFPEMNDLLVSAVLRAVRPREGLRVLELHAGIGNFSLPLALAGARVTAVERSRRASILSRRNAPAAGVEIDARESTDEESLAELGSFDLVLLDPPRTGARAVAEALARDGPARVTYVSCDSATLARDLAIMMGGGYEVVRVEAFDMFPQTAHVEGLVLLERRG